MQERASQILGCEAEMLTVWLWEGPCWMLILWQVSLKNEQVLTFSASPNDQKPSLSRPSNTLKS